ncbi:MAG: hypothetical protein ACRC8W_00430 [Plesiomonas shigelloides]
MIKYLSMAEVFNDKFDASMLKVNPECVKEPFDDGVTPHDHIEHAVKIHDELASNLEVTGQALIESCRDVVNLKKEIERLSLINAEILDSIDESVANNDLQAIALMRKKYITD